MVELLHLDAGYRDLPVLHDVTLAFRPGEVLVLAGPNGSGKSTLLKAALGLLPKTGGEILYDGTKIESLSPRQIARRAAFLAQSRGVPNITARRMVLHGRFPYLGYPRRYRPEDHRIVAEALAEADAAALADRPMAELSGGQRQKVYLAMAMAQRTETILMDEPTTFLDVEHQLAVMDTARRLAGEGRAVVMVLHDLPLALRTADRLAVLENGRLAALDTPAAVYQSGVLERVFHVRVGRTPTPAGPRYYCDPM